MTKPREKTREELTAEIEDRKKKIRQFENREKMLRQKLSVEERKARNHRICKRGGFMVARMGKKEKRLWVFFLNDKNRIQYNDQCKKCVNDCKQSFRCRIVWCGKYYSKRRKR